jgi:hypothetical protein
MISRNADRLKQPQQDLYSRTSPPIDTVAGFLIVGAPDKYPQPHPKKIRLFLYEVSPGGTAFGSRLEAAPTKSELARWRNAAAGGVQR